MVGEGALDPCASSAGASLLYRQEGNQVRCWTVGENGSDEGGPSAEGKPSVGNDDVGFRT